jgi:hypothetical protein
MSIRSFTGLQGLNALIDSSLTKKYQYLPRRIKKRYLLLRYAVLIYFLSTSCGLQGISIYATFPKNCWVVAFKLPSSSWWYVSMISCIERRGALLASVF